MSDDKKVYGWVVDVRYQDGQTDSNTIPSKAHVLREVEECLNKGAAYITVSALFRLFGSDDMGPDKASEANND